MWHVCVCVGGAAAGVLVLGRFLLAVVVLLRLFFPVSLPAVGLIVADCSLLTDFFVFLQNVDYFFEINDCAEIPF